MKRSLFILFLPLFFAIACNRSQNSTASDKLMMQREAGASVEGMALDALHSAPIDNSEAGIQPSESKEDLSTQQNHALNSPTATNDWDKKIIKTAKMLVEVKNHAAYSQKVRGLVKKFEGYIAREDQNNTDEKLESTIEIKVPAGFFDQLVNELPDDNGKQLERNISAEDVTDQMIDIQARLATKKATRDKYLEFLKQAKNVEEVLKVQEAINRIQEDIESTEGRLAYLRAATGYSTIHLSFFEPKSGYYYNHKASYGSRIIQSIIRGGSWLANLFLGVVTLWPFLILAILIGIFIRKRRQAKQFKKNG